jgi:hypothetical protein
LVGTNCLPTRLLCGLSVAVAGGAEAPGSNLLGATGVLARIPQILAASQATNQTATAASSRVKLKNDLAAFASATNQAPEMAAVDWLSLLDRFWTLPPENGEEYQIAMMNGEAADRNLSLESILAAIPGPQSWPALQKQVSARKLDEGSLPGREAQLRFLVALLSGDVPAMQSAIASLQELEKKADRYARDPLHDTIRQLQAGMLRSADSQHPESSLAAFRKMLDMQERDTGHDADAVRILKPYLYGGAAGVGESADIEPVVE